MGHAGTLDPMATGLLIIGVEKATRLLGYLALSDKAYEATIRLGISTITDDAEGEVATAVGVVGLVEAEIETAMAELRGEIFQVPAAVSAIKVGGVRSYKRVRAGESVALSERAVSIRRFDALDRKELRVDGVACVDLRVLVECSSGTYVRALAADLGGALGGGAHLRNLRRTAIGSFELAEARPPEAVTTLLSPAEALRDYPAVTVGDGAAAELSRSGRLLGGSTGPDPTFDGPLRVLDGSGRLLAVAERRDGHLRPVVVLPPPAPAG